MTAQKEFDELYITSSEIGRRLEVTRAAIIQARAKGWLPDPIKIENHITIWKRGDIEPHVANWEKRRNNRVGIE